MSESAPFDPYRKWLGIRPEEQPANHYRLLGMEPLEDDPDVIESAADARMAHLRTFQTGARSELSQKILNELAGARVCLLNPGTKKQYDLELRKEIDRKQQKETQGEKETEKQKRTEKKATAVPAPQPIRQAKPLDEQAASQPQPAEQRDAAAVAPVRVASRSVTRRHAATRRRKKSVAPALLLGGGVIAAIVVAAVLLGQIGGGKPAAKKGGNRDETETADGNDGFASGGDAAADTSGPANFDRSSQNRADALDPTDDPLNDSGEFPQRAPSDAQTEPTGSLPSIDDPGGIQPAADTTLTEAHERLPMPDNKALEAMREQFRELYADRLAAAQTNQQKAELAVRLGEMAEEMDDDPTGRYVLLHEARTMAMAAGKVDTALAASDRIGALYDLDAAALRAEAVVKSSRTAESYREQLDGLFASVELAQEMAAGDRYDEAARLYEQLGRTAERLRETSFVETAEAKRAEVENLRQRWDDTESAREKLADHPNDTAAHAALGRFYALVKEDWEKGLPHLARSASPDVSQAAQADLLSPSDPQQQVAVGDDWWKLANAVTSSSEKEHLKARALYWYQKAAPHLVGQSKLRIDGILANWPIQAGPGEPITGLDVRKLQNRKTLLAKYGGSDATEDAVLSALDWIARHQNRGGSWSFNHRVGGDCNGQCKNPGSSAESFNEATGMALMPLLAAGQTHTSGWYSESVKNGLTFLSNRMAVTPEGASFYEPQGGMFSHGRASIAVCEAAAQTGDQRLALGAQQVIRFIAAKQSASGDGWGPYPTSPGDMPHFAWQIAALKSADWGGVPVPRKTLDRAGKFLDSLQYGEGAGYHKEFGDDGEPTGKAPKYTAIGLLGRIYLGWKQNEPELAAGVDELLKNGPSKTDIEFNYFAMQVLFHYGGEPWQEFSAQMQPMLIAAQTKEGHAAGSWYFGKDETAKSLGRLYHTALATTILQTYYRYPRLYTKDPPVREKEKPKDAPPEGEFP